jgi:hypothetical protein
MLCATGTELAGWQTCLPATNHWRIVQIIGAQAWVHVSYDQARNQPD